MPWKYREKNAIIIYITLFSSKQKIHVAYSFFYPKFFIPVELRSVLVEVEQRPNPVAMVVTTVEKEKILKVVLRTFQLFEIVSHCFHITYSNLNKPGIPVEN